MPAYSRHELEDYHRAQRPERQAMQPSHNLEDRPSPAYSNSLLGDARLNGRGNGPVKVAMMRQAQQGYGNRAVQSRMVARAHMQRQPKAAPEAPAPQQDTVTKKTLTAPS